MIIKENKMENNEVWKYILGYEGLYKISNKGRVKSIGYGKERILKPANNGRGYLKVDLCKNGDKKWCLVHRLVAQAFIPNPNNLPEVNHLDENKENNRVENLEFCDRKYNCNYGTTKQRMIKKLSKTVFQYSKDGEFIKEWKSVMDVERNLGYAQTNISSCCLGKYKSAYGFVWRYKQII